MVRGAWRLAAAETSRDRRIGALFPLTADQRPRWLVRAGASAANCGLFHVEAARTRPTCNCSPASDRKRPCACAPIRRRRGVLGRADMPGTAAGRHRPDRGGSLERGLRFADGSWRRPGGAAVARARWALAYVYLGVARLQVADADETRQWFKRCGIRRCSWIRESFRCWRSGGGARPGDALRRNGSLWSGGVGRRGGAGSFAGVAGLKPGAYRVALSDGYARFSRMLTVAAGRTERLIVPLVPASGAADTR